MGESHRQRLPLALAAPRAWAISVVNRFSNVPLSSKVQEELQYRASQKDVLPGLAVVENDPRQLSCKRRFAWLQRPISSECPERTAATL